MDSIWIAILDELLEIVVFSCYSRIFLISVRPRPPCCCYFLKIKIVWMHYKCC